MNIFLYSPCVSHIVMYSGISFKKKTIKQKYWEVTYHKEPKSLTDHKHLVVEKALTLLLL